VRSFFVAITLILFGSVAQAQVADTVYTNGKIYTVNERQPWAEAVATTAAAMTSNPKQVTHVATAKRGPSDVALELRPIASRRVNDPGFAQVMHL
jgi:hypothetical protein